MVTFLILSGIPSQIKASTTEKADKNESVSNESVNSNVQLNEIKSIELSTLNSAENKEILKESIPVDNEQGRHKGQIKHRRGLRNNDVMIQTNQGYGHRHTGAYIGGGGLLLLILILVLVL